MRFRYRSQLAVMAVVLAVGYGATAEARPEQSVPAAEGKGEGTTGASALPAMPLPKSAGIDVSHPYGYYLQPILEKIKATGDQRVKIVAIVQSYKVKIQPLRDEYKVKRQDFLTTMTSGGAAEMIMAKQVELSHLASEITSKYCLMRLEVRRVLTPEQILLFEDYARVHGWNSH